MISSRKEWMRGIPKPPCRRAHHYRIHSCCIDRARDGPGIQETTLGKRTSGEVFQRKEVASHSPDTGSAKIDATRILLVDDDAVLAGMLGEFLEREGCAVHHAGNGEDALDRISRNVYDLLVLDIMMPRMNGLDVLRELRGGSTLPVIMLTARGDDLDRILGLELGADDYVSKPFNPRELLARIRAVLRRTHLMAENQSTEIEQGDIRINPATRGVVIGQNTREKRPVSLTQTEFDLLYLLLLKPGQLVTKSSLSTQVLDKPLSKWDRSIDVHISNLRKKLGPFPHGGNRIRTVRGIGYLYHSGERER